MSGEAMTPEKTGMDTQYILKLTLTLFLTCVVVAGLLGVVNSITEERIEAITWQKTVTAMQKVITAEEFSDALPLTEAMTAAASGAGGTLDAVYEARSGGQTVGYAVSVTASGSQGAISMMVGLDAAGSVTGVSIIKNSETAGIGSKVMNNEPLPSGIGVLEQFEGKSLGDGALSVGGGVDAITGATVSTRGVTAGVNAALAAAGAMN